MTIIEVGDAKTLVTVVKETVVVVEDVVTVTKEVNVVELTTVVVGVVVTQTVGAGRVVVPAVTPRQAHAEV